MKLKKKHLEIAKTISYFVDRNYFPEFQTPTNEQIRIFTQIESRGFKGLAPHQIKLVEPMLNGKHMYDLQIKCIHEELAEWIQNKSGWFYPIVDIFKHVWPERKNLRVYLRMLVSLIRKMRDTSGLEVMLEYSGFSETFKQKLINEYFRC
jgi:hypothetical protein